MSYRNALTLIVAGCCLVAVVNMSAALETSVSGTPDDVVDVDTDSLPLPSDETGDLKEAVQSESQSGEPSSVRSQPSDSTDQSSTSESGGEGEPQEAGPSGGSGDSRTQPDEGSRDGSGTKDGTGSGGAVDRLLSLLWTWFERLLGVLAVLLLLGGAGLLVWKRAFLWAQLRRYFGGETPASDAGDAYLGDRTRSPANQIERRWLEMVSADDTGDPNLTPRERADRAVESGLVREPVRKLTALFEGVRYGDQPVTTSEVQRASTYLEQARGQTDD